MSFSRKVSRGFTLIELLVVVALIAILSALAAPAVSSITQARGVADAAEQISAAVEMARSEAVTRRTYVWMALQEQTNAGSADLLLGMAYSKDGSATNHATNNLQPLARPLTFKQVGLTNSTGVPGNPRELAGFSGGIDMDLGSSAKFTARRSITFTPLGEVLTTPSPTPSSPFERLMALGVAAARGPQLDQNNIASVAIDGSTGIPTVYRK
jgi:prepilin-type N-terminal cleavage/methylation domain-containing protein